MSRTFINKKTNQTITIPDDELKNETESVSPVLSGNPPPTLGLLGAMEKNAMDPVIAERVKQDIEKRGTLWGEIGRNISSPSPLKKTIGAMQTIGSPFTLLESSIANPSLIKQQGNFSPIAGAKESILGILGLKQGQYGDVLQLSGISSLPAKAIGFGMSFITPSAALKTASKVFGQVALRGDKMILEAGNLVKNASFAAEKAMGGKLDDAYKVIDFNKVNEINFSRAVSELPKNIYNLLKNEFPRIDKWKNVTIKQARAVKEYLGRIKSSSFGKAEKAAAENAIDIAVNKAYAMLSQEIHRSIKNVSEVIDEGITVAEKAFHATRKASETLRKTVMHPQLLEATEAGKLATKMMQEGQVGSRFAMNVLKGRGNVKGIPKEIVDQITKAQLLIDKFNDWQKMVFFRKRIANAAIMGGAVGSVGGRAAGAVIKRKEGD